jgi:glycosyltransferase involved in cell wall biosynthesis
MNPQPLLSIAIPTYNRPESLRRTIESLLPQLDDTVSLLIVDNASEVPVDNAIAHLSERDRARITVHRNQFNVGMCANFCRCFELCKTPWLWIISDDDSPKADAVAAIEGTLATQQEHCVFVNFSSGGIYRHEQQRTFVGKDELWQYSSDLYRFGNLLFISTGVYRAAEFQRWLRIGYHYNYTAAPHLAMLLPLLAEGRSVAVTPQYLVDWQLAEKSQIWNWPQVALGLMSLPEVEYASPRVQTCIARVLPRYLPTLRELVRWVINDTARPPEFWRMFFWRLIGASRGRHRVKAFIPYVIALVLSWMPAARRLFPNMTPVDTTHGSSRL